MATYTRNNAWNNGGTLEGNADLFWYAIGVGQMMQRDVTDPKSWWYFAAIHGEAQEWGSIPAPPQVPQLPASDQQGWNQCQHGTWYFPPWHRGYLIALENQVREDVAAQGGPATWALPYWNYFGQANPANQFNIPPAFTEQTLPAAGSLPPGAPAGVAGSPNPLYCAARYGPNNDGNVFVPTEAAGGPVTEACMSDTAYTGSSEFGGGQTGFEHAGNPETGQLENNPHNLVHVYVGGQQGMMSDPDMAAIDPVFYAHHANIDRMWAVWNVTLGNPNENDPSWVFGPTTGGQSDFEMPKDGAWWRYTPGDVADMSKQTYTYDDMSAPGVVPAPQALTARLAALGAAAPAAAAAVEATPVQPGTQVELVGATQAPVQVTGAGARAQVRLDTGVRRKVVQSLTNASRAAPPDHVYMRLDNVTGAFNGALSVYINMPEGADPGQYQHLRAGAVGLFGVRQASDPAGKHGGKGMNFTLDITKVVDQLHLSQSFDLDTLNVNLVASGQIPGSAALTVGRISIYRRGR